MRRAFSRWICVAAVFVAACGGGSAPGEGAALAPQRAPIASSLVVSGEQLLDWAEQQYPGFFSTHAVTQAVTLSGITYYYRAYPGGNYAAYGDNNGVYALGPQLTGNNIQQFGLVADYTCIVLAAQCNAALLTGTAASGAPISNATVTVVDGSGAVRTGTTNASGAFSVGVGGLVGQLLLKVQAAGGKTLYGVTADGYASFGGVANITPFTDLIVRSWYGVQGVSAGAAFAAPGTYAPPSALQTKAVAQAVLQMAQLSFVVADAGVSQALDMITLPFIANHTGLDAVLDATTLTANTSGATLSIAGAGLAQSTAVTFDPTHSAITAVTTTTSANGASSSSLTSVIPVTAQQVQAWTGIESELAAFAGTINARGSSLAASDILPFLDTALVNDGLNRNQFAANVVSSFGFGATVSLSLRTLESLDLAAGHARAIMTGSESYQGQSREEAIEFDFANVGAQWLLSGNGRPAHISFYAEARVNQGAYTGGNGPSINVDVEAPRNAISGVTVTTPAGGTMTVTHGAIVVDDSGLQLDMWFANSGPLPVSAIPVAGSLYTVGLAQAVGGNVSVQVPINAVTTESAPITNLSGGALALAHLGGSLDVQWQLPRTYAIGSVKLSALYFTSTDESNPSTYQCETPESVLSTTATAATLNIPSTCNGQAVKAVNVNLNVNGINGERSSTIYQFN